MTPNSTIFWQQNQFKTDNFPLESWVHFDIGYPQLDWDFLRSIYGWTALQYQTWVRGELLNSAPVIQRIVLYTSNILELWINNEFVFGGDFFGFERAPVVLDLQPGQNIVNVRLIRDVRANGGEIPPTIKASLRAELVAPGNSVFQSNTLLPDVVDGQLPSQYGSVTIRNQGFSPITVKGLHLPNHVGLCTLVESGITIMPCQSRPVSFLLDLNHTTPLETHAQFEFSSDGDEISFASTLRLSFTAQDMYSPHKITFLHPSGAVSYAILRPPPHSNYPQNTSLPILVSLHGAGVDADSDLVRHAFDEASHLDAWLLFPTGMSLWSGDDWHNWGSADIQAAIKAITQWVETMNWTGPGVQTDKVLISGHSNGGQGSWYFATHQPDRVIAAAPVSGYSSIENYVPYTMWGEADPLQSAILQIARNSFHHELLVDNIKDLPILDQHGGNDDNVPPYHSRLMSSLLRSVGSDMNYVELPGKGHWFEKVMTTVPLLEFYAKHLKTPSNRTIVPPKFTIICPNTNDMGSRYGILVDQLHSADRLGRIETVIAREGNATVWYMKTSNIHRLHFDPDQAIGDTPDYIQIDETLAFDLTDDIDIRNASFVQLSPRQWLLEGNNNWKTIGQRFGRQRGTMDAILQTQGPFEVIRYTEGTLDAVLQITRNLLQYYGADSKILSRSGYEMSLHGKGNLITVILGTDIPRSLMHDFPISIDSEGVHLRLRDSVDRTISTSNAIGGAWLRPLSDERLELIIWGLDSKGLRQASRLAPTITGAGQPDFVILGRKASWAGHSGALALGFFDYDWNISKASYIY